RHDRGRVVILTGRARDHGLQNAGFGVRRAREVWSFDGVEVAERAWMIAGHEVRPRLFEEAVEPVLAAGIDQAPVPARSAELGSVGPRGAVVIEPDRPALARWG